MKNGKDFLKERGLTPNALVVDLLDKYRLVILEDVKLGFDICSDFSTQCLGYRNLVDRIVREKENEKPTVFPVLNSPYNPFNNDEV